MAIKAYRIDNKDGTVVYACRHSYDVVRNRPEPGQENVFAVLCDACLRRGEPVTRIEKAPPQPRTEGPMFDEVMKK